MKYFLKYINIILSITLMLSACSQMENPIVSYEKVVKIETKWLADNNGIKKYKIYNKEYDRNGKLIKIIEYDSNGVSKIIHNFKYLENKIIESIDYLNSDINNNLISQIITSLDSSGKINKQVELTNKGIIISTYNYSYDKDGKLISTTIKKDSDKESKIIEFSYSPNGSLNNSIEKNYITGSISSSDLISYNYNNSSIDKITYDNNGQIKTIISTSYNKFGKVYKEIENNPNLKIINTYIYEYIYY